MEYRNASFSFWEKPEQKMKEKASAKM